MDDVLRVIEPKSYETVKLFCKRLEQSNKKGVHTVGIYSGTIVDNSKKENYLENYNKKVKKKELIRLTK